MRVTLPGTGRDWDVSERTVLVNTSRERLVWLSGSWRDSRGLAGSVAACILLRR